MRLLDLFCGAGGCGWGYHLAGFTEITGVDRVRQPRYPFRAVVADALDYLAGHGREYDFIHASPPCQAYSTATYSRGRGRVDYPDLVGPLRDLLISNGVPWIIENVEGAPLRAPAVQLCGLMFGLRVFRHRWFESSLFLLVPAHLSHRGRRIGRDGFVTVAGKGGSIAASEKAMRAVTGERSNAKTWAAAMEINWMQRGELAQAIPPAYTAYLGRQVLRQLGGEVSQGGGSENVQA